MALTVTSIKPQLIMVHVILLFLAGDECCKSEINIFMKLTFSNNHRNVQNETQSSTL